jgi:hypothetical protein
VPLQVDAAGVRAGPEAVVTERSIRRLVPNLGRIDISPVILFLVIIFLRYVIALYILPHAY